MMAMRPNPAQEEAASTLVGPVLIAAGAGSGKTRTLAERFARALSDAPSQGWAAASVDDIVTITFTDKAAGELALRIRGLLRRNGGLAEARAVDSAWISTIHGFCSRVLRRHALRAGLDPAFRVLDSVESGGIEEEAFSQAASAVVVTPDGLELFDGFEFQQVFDAVRRITRELRTRGLGADALTSVPVRRAADVYRESLELFAEAGERVAACGDSRPAATKLIQRCAAVQENLACIEPVALREAELAVATWGALRDWRPGTKSGAIEAVRQELMDRHALLMEEAAGCAAEPLVRAMRALVSEYLGRYAQLKRDRGAVDFDDLQVLTLSLLQSSPEVLDECRALFRMVMVDEFQDTDGLQAALVGTVGGDNLCTVGDESQSIYGFRGADVGVYRAHNDRMRARGAKVVTLALNYRSHADVIGFVNGFFGHESLLGESLLPLEHGRAESDPPLIPGGEPRIELIMVDKGEASTSDALRREADAISERFAALRDTHGVRGGDMVVLLRTYRHAEVFATALRARQFEATVVGGGRFFGRREVAMLRALVRVIANPADELALAQVLASDLGRLSDDALLAVAASARSDGSRMPLWDALGAPPELEPDDAARARGLRETLERAREAACSRPLADVLLRVVEETDLDLMMLAGGEEGRQSYANVLKFARLASGFERSGGAGPAGFTRHLDAQERFGERVPPATLGGEQGQAVRIMSIHAAKGLEFPVVAVSDLGSAGGNERDFVRTRASDDGCELAVAVRMSQSDANQANRPAAFREMDERAKRDQLEESKRILYVACTRAREALLLSGVTTFTGELDSRADSPLVWVRRILGDDEIARSSGSVVRVNGDVTVRVDVLPLAGPPDRRVIREERQRREPNTAPRAERRRATPPRAPERLSYSDLALFDRCELRFWAEKVARIRSLQRDDSDGPVRLGSAVHAALQLVPTGGPLPEERLVALARAHRLDEEHAARLANAVRTYVGSALEATLEAVPVVRREWPFGIRLEAATGKVDLIGSLDAYGRDGTTGLVVDYKTGTREPDPEVRERFELQARCYGLAAIRDGCEQVDVVFALVECPDGSGEPARVSYAFAASEARGIEEEILARHARMMTGEHRALDRWEPSVCAGCPIAGGLCAVSAPRVIGTGGR